MTSDFGLAMLIDDADRTLPPTERRRREARLRGEVASSSELTGSLVLLVASTMLWWLAPAWATGFATYLRHAITTQPSLHLTVPQVEKLGWQTGQFAASILLPAACILFAAAILANAVQTGWLWVPARLVPRFRFHNPVSLAKSFDAFGILLRFGVLGTVTWYFFVAHQSQFFSQGMGEPATAFMHSARLIGQLLFQLSLSLVGLALVDYGIRFWQNERRLMMTVDERRQEQRDDDPDPRFKRQRAGIRSRLNAEVPSVEAIGRTAIRR